MRETGESPDSAPPPPESSQNICKRCVLPEAKPNVYFNGEGVCNLCVEYASNKKTGQKNKLLESDPRSRQPFPFGQRLP